MLQDKTLKIGVMTLTCCGGRTGKTVEEINRPIIITSKTNPFVSEEITTTAWQVLQDGGSPLDAAEKATDVSELDPRDPTVGYGGDPNEEGFLQLDACAMSGPDGNNVDAVAALENIKTPCRPDGSFHRWRSCRRPGHTRRLPHSPRSHGRG